MKVFSRPDVAEVMQRFTLLRVDLSHEDEDPALGAIKRKYGADTLPAIRIVSPDGRDRRQDRHVHPARRSSSRLLAPAR